MPTVMGTPTKSSRRKQRGSAAAPVRPCRSLVFLTVLMSIACKRAESYMKFDELTYTVAEMMGPPQKLTIRADGAMRYESHSNTSTPDNPEIGVYEGTLSPAEMAALNHSVADPPFQNLPDHRGRVAAGDRYQRLAVSTGSGRDEVMIGTREPVDSQ